MKIQFWCGFVTSLDILIQKPDMGCKLLLLFAGWVYLDKTANKLYSETAQRYHRD